MTTARGFSLIELLIAVTLLGMVTLLGYSGLRLGMNYWRTAQTIAEQQQQTRVIRHYIERQLAAATRRQEDQRQPGEAQLRGTPDKVSFIAPLAAEQHRGGLYRIELLSRSRPDRPAEQQLVLGFRPLQQSVTGRAIEMDYEPLLAGVKGVELSYFGSQTSGAPPSWQGSWRHPDRLPLQVRLRYRDPQPHELVVSLPMGSRSNDG